MSSWSSWWRTLKWSGWPGRVVLLSFMLWGIIENTQDKFHVYWSHMNFPPSKRKKKMTISCEQKNKTKKIFNFTFVLYGRSNLRTGPSTVIHRLETTLIHVDTHSDTHTLSHRMKWEPSVDQWWKAMVTSAVSQHQPREDRRDNHNIDPSERLSSAAASRLQAAQTHTRTACPTDRIKIKRNTMICKE